MSDAAVRSEIDRPSRIRWYFNRLRCMTPAELPHRVARTLAAHAESRGLCRNEVPRPRFEAAGTRFVEVPDGIDAGRCLDAADRIVAGRFDLFALDDVRLGNPPCWNRDPKTGVLAPLTFGKLLDYRDPRRVGDIKYLWELNRHQHLVTLAQAHALGGDRRYAETLFEHLDSWFRACPYRLGANWTSALEAAIRLINWSLVWQLLGGPDAPTFRDDGGRAFRDRWLQSVYRHARFVRGNFSRHSSANNHLIGEAAGLYVAACTWPFWPAMAVWREAAAAVLEREVALQNAADGVNREQAVSYQQFELDLMLLSWRAAAGCGERLSDGFAACLERMAGYLAAIMDVRGNVPMVGDSDDGCVVRLSHEDDFCRYRSVLAAAAVLFKRADFRYKACRLDEKTRWLLGGAATSAWRAPDPPPTTPARRAFPEGGYYVMGSDFETDDEIRLLIDAGPLGYPEIAAHGHADALSFTLSVGGSEFLVDPGTYAYHADGRWRAYFRGTAAHNTVVVDGRDQSEPGGNFMWLRKARAGCTLWQPGEDLDLFEGWQDGYRRLPDPVIHHRRIALDKRRRRIRVEDRLLACGTHDVALHFHLGEHCHVALEGLRAALQCLGRHAEIHLPDGGEIGVYHGSEAPILGWISRRYDRRVPSPTIAWRTRVSGDAILRTEIRC